MHIRVCDGGDVVGGGGSQALDKHLRLRGICLVCFDVHPAGTVKSDVAAEGRKTAVDSRVLDEDEITLRRRRRKPAVIYIGIGAVVQRANQLISGHIVQLSPQAGRDNVGR